MSAAGRAKNEAGSRGFSLVVTADDFGIGVETSRGIIQSHLRGPVAATSLMVVTGDHVRASVPMLAQAPELDVGLHLVLTRCGEKPLAARQSSGLVGRDGEFLSNGQLWIRAWTGKLNRAAIVEEMAAQAEMFRELVGREADYVDCHHHAHQLPIVREALVEVIARGLLPRVTRVTIEPKGNIGRVGSVRMKRMAANFVGKRAGKVFGEAQMWTNDFYFGMLSSADLERSFPWDRYLEVLPREKVVEWVVHPGMVDETLDGRDGYRLERAKELEALTSVEGVAKWEHLRPFLSRKSQLARPIS